jgi:hypothetical protein
VSTYAFLDVYPFIFCTVGIIIKHVFEVGIMALIAGSLVVDGVGEESVEAETYQEGLAHLSRK